MNKDRYTKEKFLQELNEALNEFNEKPAIGQKPAAIEKLLAQARLNKGKQ